MLKSIRQSHINLFCKCQEAFRRRYCEEEIIPPAIAMAVGTGVHKAAEKNHRQKLFTQTDIPIEEMQDAAAEGFMAEVEQNGVFFTGDTQELHKELGKSKDLSVRLARAYGENFASTIQPQLIEATLEARHPELPIPFSGTVDVVDINDVCIDLKTARVKWRKGKEAETVQPAMYKYLLKEAQGITAWFDFYVMAYNGDVQTVPVEIAPEALRPAVAISKAMLNAMQTGVFMPAVPGHWMCSEDWCGYYATCKVRG